MTDESKGGGSPGTPKTPVGTFLPWSGWPTSKNPPNQVVGHEVAQEEIRERAKKVELNRAIRALGVDPKSLKGKDPSEIAEIIKKEIVRSQMIENFEAEAKEKGEFAFYSAGKDVKIKDDSGNIVKAIATSFKGGHMTVRWVENGIEKEKTLTDLSEIIPDDSPIVQQQNTSSPEKKRIGSKEYAVGDEIEIKRKKGDGKDKAKIVSFHGDEIKVQVTSADGVKVNKKISPLEIYEEDSRVSQSTPDSKKETAENKFSRRPADVFIRISKAPEGHKRAGKWQIKTERGWKDINEKGTLSEDDLDSIKNILRKYRNFIATDNNNLKIAERNPELVYAKDDLLDRLERGDFEVAKEKSKELQNELNKSISAERDRKRSRKITSVPAASPSVVAQANNTSSPAQSAQSVPVPPANGTPENKNVKGRLSETIYVATSTKILQKLILRTEKGKSVWYKKDKDEMKPISPKEITGRPFSPKEWSSIVELLEEFKDFMSVNTASRATAYQGALAVRKELDRHLNSLDFNSTRDAVVRLKEELAHAKKINAEVIASNLQRLSAGPSPLKTDTWTPEFIKDLYGNSLHGTTAKYINPQTGEWEFISEENLPFFEKARDALQNFHNSHNATPEMIEKKNEILNHLNTCEFEMAGVAADEYFELINSKQKISWRNVPPSSSQQGASSGAPASGSASGNGGAGVPPSGSGGGASIPPSGAGSAPAAPGQPKKKPLDIQSVWPTNISLKKEKGKSGWYITDATGNSTRLPNNDAWGKENANAKPVFDAYLRFINDPDVKQKNKKWEICTDLINLKNDVIKELKNQNLDAASILREDLRTLTEKWVADWPKMYEKYTLVDDFEKQKREIAELNIRMGQVTIKDIDKFEVKEYQEVLAEYEALVDSIPKDKKTTPEERNLFGAYKEIFELYKNKVISLEGEKRKVEGTRGSVLHPLKPNRQWRRLVNGKIVFSPTQEWVDQQNVKKEDKQQEKEASIAKTEAELRARHEKMFLSDPKAYIALFDKKFDNNNVDADDLEKKTVDFILGKDGGGLNSTRKKLIDAKRKELEDEESTQIKIPKNRMSGASYTFVPTKKSERALDNQMRKNIDPVTLKTKINPETNQPETYNAGKTPGLVKMEKVPRTEARPGRKPEESRLRAKRVESLMSSFEKLGLKNWKAWAVATGALVSAVGYMGTAGASENNKPETQIEASQMKENWREAFNKSATEDDKKMLENISNTNDNNLSLIKKYLNAPEPYPESVLSLDAHRILYDSSSPDFEGTTDPSSKKSYRAEISKILKSGMNIASSANNGNEVKPKPEETVNEFLTRVKSIVGAGDKKRNS